jgi:hypothetical protein
LCGARVKLGALFQGPGYRSNFTLFWPDSLAAGASEIELQVMQGVVSTDLNLRKEIQQRRERWGFLHLEAVRIRQRRRE